MPDKQQVARRTLWVGIGAFVIAVALYLQEPVLGLAVGVGAAFAVGHSIYQLRLDTQVDKEKMKRNIGWIMLVAGILFVLAQDYVVAAAHVLGAGYLLWTTKQR